MKKAIFVAALAMAGAISLWSCQESTEKQENTIVNKIEAGEALTQDDYSVMIDYVGEYAEKAQKYVDMEINDENLAQAATELNNLNKEYPDLIVYRNYLRLTPSSALSADNLEKVGKYAGYVEFTAPSGYTLETAPSSDAGMEVEAPPVDNGVVAGAVDNVKVDDGSRW